MKTMLWTVWGVIFVAGAASSQPQVDMTRILFGTRTEYHFGPVKRGADISHSFRMTNPYKVPVTITGIRTSCGCSAATPSKTMLRPRETANLEVRIDTRRFAGPKEVVTYVRVKGPGLPEDEARLLVTVESK